MDLPVILEPVVHYFFARPLRLFVLAGVGALTTAIFQLWLRSSKPGMAPPSLAIVSSIVAAAPLLLFGVLSLLWSLFCFRGGPDGAFGAGASMIGGCLFAIAASIGSLVALWSLRAALKTKCHESFTGEPEGGANDEEHGHPSVPIERHERAPRRASP